MKTLLMTTAIAIVLTASTAYAYSSKEQSIDALMNLQDENGCAWYQYKGPDQDYASDAEIKQYKKTNRIYCKGLRKRIDRLRNGG